MPIDVDPLIHALYEAPLFSGGWAEFTKVLQATLLSTDCALISYGSTAGPPVIGEYCGDPATAALYERYYGAINPWMPAIQKLPTGVVATGEELLAIERLQRTEFYNEFGRKCGVVHTAGVVLISKPGQLAFLSVDRGEGAGEFPAEQVTLLARLVPHLQRAVRIQHALQAPAGPVDEPLKPGEARFLLDSTGRVLQATAEAESLLRAGVVRLRHGAHLDLTGLCDFPLREALAAAVPVERTFPAKTRGTLRPVVELRPTLLRTTNLFARTLSFVLTLRFPPGFSHPLQRFALQWGLTIAEIHLVQALQSGRSLRACAAERGISYNTVKTQLASIYAKSSCRSQAQLMRALLDSANHPAG